MSNGFRTRSCCFGWVGLQDISTHIHFNPVQCCCSKLSSFCCVLCSDSEWNDAVSCLQMYIALISAHALVLCGFQFFSCVRGQWTECSDFSPPVTVILMIFLCLEGFLFLTFTAVMFGTQIHSICNDETEIERLKSEKPTWERRLRWEGMKSVFGGQPSLLWINPFAGFRIRRLLLRGKKGGPEFSVWV